MMELYINFSIMTPILALNSVRLQTYINFNHKLQVRVLGLCHEVRPRGSAQFEIILQRIIS